MLFQEYKLEASMQLDTYKDDLSFQKKYELE